MAKTELTLEEQIAKLQDQNSELTKKSDAQARTIERVGKIESQGQQLALAKQALDKATSEVGQNVERIRELEAEAEANEQTITGLEAKVRQAEAGGDGSTAVTYDDQIYRVVVPQFHFEGRLVKAEALTSDATLVAKLVEAGSGVLEKVTK